MPDGDEDMDSSDSPKSDEHIRDSAVMPQPAADVIVKSREINRDYKGKEKTINHPE